MTPFKHCIRVKRALKVEGKRLTGGKWTALRNTFMRLNPSCARCGRPGEQVHHIIPRAVRPDLTYEWANLQTVCCECHNSIHNNAI